MSKLRVLVTGGGRGIGRAIALRFAREQAKVMICARTSSELDKVVGEIQAAGGEGAAGQVNLIDHGTVEAAVYRAVEFLGGSIDVLVNNAGDFELAPFEKMNIDIWTRMIDINLNGPFYVTLEARDALIESGRAHVINIASQAGKRGFPGATAYCAAKYGLRGFSDALRVDLAPHKVRVSTIYPGQTNTTIFDGVPGTWDRQKMNSPEEVAEVVWRTWSAPPETNVDDVDVPPRP